MTGASNPTTKITREHTWVLNRLRNEAGYESALIAGGAVRDTYFKKPISDIDIFYLHSNHNPNEVLQRKYTELESDKDKVIKLLDLDIGSNDPYMFTFGDQVKVIFDATKRKIKPVPVANLTNITASTPTTPNYAYGNQQVVSIINVEKDDTRYQLIALNVPTMEYITKHFDINLCRCWCDGTRMRYSSEFLRDARQQTLTIEGQMSMYLWKRTHAYHIPKLRKKYPNFTVVDTLQYKYNKKP